MLSEYRQRFGQFHTDLSREDYLFRSGRKSARESAHIFSEYSDLFRLSAVEELRAVLKETAEYRETEAKSIRRLIAFALENNLAARTRDVSVEIERYESAARIDWDGKPVSFHRSAELLANEADARRRRDLYARRAGVIQGTQDLRAERFEKLHEGVREIGFESYVAMRRELHGPLKEMDCEGLATQAEQILAKTESRYVSSLAPLLLREAGVSIDQATAADLGWLRRYARFDAFFGREQMPRIYRDLFAALGFDTEKQSNVAIDSTPRPNKQPQAFCSPIEVPDEIKLVVNFIGGQQNYREFLRAAGRAQHFAWTSRNLYPEFRIGGDAAVGKAWGLLFEHLPLEPDWLAGTLGFVETAEFCHAQAVFRLMALRRQAAKIIYEVEFHTGKLSGNTGARYAELMTAAVRVRFDEAEHLRDLSEDFRPGDDLRAAAFEAQVRDYLKTQFGSHWWSSRKAGETLIDLWNTGHQYSA
jgi:hypothetical protein